MSQLNNKTKGIWCKKDQKWYWLDSGEMPEMNSLDRLRRILMVRELIDISNRDEQYKMMDLEQAKASGYEPVCIYASDHIRAIRLLQQEKEVKKPADVWSKS